MNDADGTRPHRHQVVVGLGAAGFKAICSCGWQSESSWDRAVVATAGAAHKRPPQERPS